MRHTHHSTSISALTDSLLALCLVVGATCLANRTYILHNGLASFLSIRITVLNASFCIIFAVLWKYCLRTLGLYRNGFTEFVGPLLRAAAGCSIMTALLALYLVVRNATEPTGLILIVFFVLTFVYEACRVLFTNRNLRKSVEPKRVIILGSGRLASKAWRELRLTHERDRRLLGFMDNRDPSLMPPDVSSRFIGSVDELSGYLLKNVVDELIIATPLRSCYDFTQRAVSIAETAGVRVVFVNDPFLLTHGKHLRNNTELFLELVPSDHSRVTAETAKRAFDFIAAAIMLVVTSPLLLVIGLAIKVTSPGPILFVQQRYGFARRRFAMYKFRSMVQNAEDLQTSLENQNEAQGPIFKIKNDPRITSLGRFLRRTSLDELPQLWNVVLGDMSLVGPRPMSVRDVSFFDEAMLMRRFSVRPGLTGIWQVAGRSSLSFDQWITLDFSYIDDWSLLLDLKILARTVPAVLKRSGAV